MGDGPLERTMFWTGAMIALMPVALGLIVLWVVWRNRRKRGDGSGGQG